MYIDEIGIMFLMLFLIIFLPFFLVFSFVFLTLFALFMFALFIIIKMIDLFYKPIAATSAAMETVENVEIVLPEIL